MFFSVWIPFKLFDFVYSKGYLVLGIDKRIGGVGAPNTGGDESREGTGTPLQGLESALSVVGPLGVDLPLLTR